MLGWEVIFTNCPCDRVSFDFADVKNGEYIIIIIDNFTLYSEVIPLKTLTGSKVIHETDNIADYEIPTS